MQSLSTNISLLESCISRLDEKFSLSGTIQKKARNKTHFEKSADYYINDFTTADTDALVDAIVIVVNLLSEDEFWEEKVGKMILRSFATTDGVRARTLIRATGLSNTKKGDVNGIYNKIIRGHVGDYQ
jgi:hypothetical protein